MKTQSAIGRIPCSARASVLVSILILVSLCALSALAQTPPDPREQLFVYSVNRVPERTFDTGRAVDIVTVDEAWRRNARSLPDVLMEEAGVFIQQTNYGAGSPIIRGLMGKQIMILIDGVKVNNATYRFGPVQYLSTIDLRAVERIEIVRGVGSVLGSDALGGVINIIMKKGPGIDDPAHSSRIIGRYSSADHAWTSHAESSGKQGDLRYTAGASYHSTGNLHASGIGSQIATGDYTERAANLFAEYALPKDRFVSIAYNVFQQNDVPRTDRIASGANLRFMFDPQRLQFARATFEDGSITPRNGLDRLQVTAYWNRQDEGNEEIRTDRPDILRMMDDSQTMIGLNAEMASTIGKASHAVYGVEYSSEDIRSRRNDLDMTAGTIRTARGKFTDGASYETLALYAQNRTHFGKWVTATVGGRYARFTAGGSENTARGELTLDSRVSDVTGSVGVIAHATPSLNLIFNTTQGFRAPNIEDLSVFDERPTGTEVPNPDLEAEKIVMYELGLKHSTERSSISAFVYQSNLADLLVRASGTYNGLPYFDNNGNGIRDASEPLVLQKQNHGKARVRGAELDWSFRPRSGWTWFGNVTRTRGDDQLADEPLSRIPPTFGTMGIRWSPAFHRQPWVEGIVTAAAAQRRLNSADKADSRIGIDGTDGFTVVNLRGGLSLGEHLRLSLAWENVLDELYKLHGSGVYRAASQVVVGVEVGF